MKWEKASAGLVRVFERAVPNDSRVEKRTMFGYPCAFANGQMFMGCHQGDDLALRLGDDDRQTFMSLDGARPFEPMPGRPMKEYVVVPNWMLESATELQSWVERSLSYVLTLPPKRKAERGKARNKRIVRPGSEVNR